MSRDAALFLVGIAGIIWQTVVDDTDRPYLLAVFALCVGLPAYLSVVGITVKGSDGK